MKILPIAAMVAVGFLLLSFPATAATIHVPDEEPTIQAGIDAASYGDTVLVACGPYYEHDIIMKSGVYLTSETGLADCVTIDAQQQGRVFYCDGVDDSASIVGFTITGGLVYYGSHPYGGGVWCRSSCLSFTNCTFSGNRAISGGGMRCTESSSLALMNCTFVGNDVLSDGGGLSCRVSSPTLISCTLEGNSAVNTGGGMDCSGPTAHPTLTDCTFSGNDAGFYGGGMLCTDASSPTLTDCTFSGNDAGSYGGGMFCMDASSPTLTDCTFSSNQASDGGGMGCSDSSATLTHCIIAFSQQGEAVYCYDAESDPILMCCDVYGNAGGDWVGCIADQYGINGNISEDPLFCGDLNPDEPYTLHADSPCAPENNPECGLIGAWGAGCGLTPVQAASWGSIKALYK